MLSFQHAEVSLAQSSGHPIPAFCLLSICLFFIRLLPPFPRAMQRRSCEGLYGPVGGNGEELGMLREAVRAQTHLASGSSWPTCLAGF